MPTDVMVIGGGKMGEALARGLCAAGAVLPGQLTVAEASTKRRDELAGPGGLLEAFPEVGLVGADESQTLRPDSVIVAVKPADVAAACRLARHCEARRLLSIAAGVTTESLVEWSGGSASGIKVLRAMPNTAVLVGAGATALSGAIGTGEDDLAWAERMLGAVGTVVRVAETHLDAVTGLSGSGPAYLFLVVEALVDAGVLVGLARPVAMELTIQTLLGAARLLGESGGSPAELRAAVTSPGGTTAAGLAALEAAAVRSAFSAAVVAATERSRQLGSPS